MRRGRLPDREGAPAALAQAVGRDLLGGGAHERGAQVAVAVRAHEEQVERRVFGVVGDHFAGVAVKAHGARLDAFGLELGHEGGHHCVEVLAAKLDHVGGGRRTRHHACHRGEADRMGGATRVEKLVAGFGAEERAVLEHEVHGALAVFGAVAGDADAKKRGPFGELVAQHQDRTVGVGEHGVRDGGSCSRRNARGCP